MNSAENRGLPDRAADTSTIDMEYHYLLNEVSVKRGEPE